MSRAMNAEMQQRAEVTRYREGGSIHAGPADGNDYTLCGAALEGEDGDAEMQKVARGKINCDQCVAIIKHCKTIPANLVAKSA